MSSCPISNSQKTVLAAAARSTVKRSPQRACYERQAVYELIDELKTGHIAFVENGEPRCIPMTLWRWQDCLYFHVLQGGRLAKRLKVSHQCPDGPLLCVSFAQTLEWVMSKSAFHHSANYRSAVLFGRAIEVVNKDEFDNAFKAIIDQLQSGRWDQIRPPSEKERKATALFCVAIEEGSFKSRSGGPNEEPEDLGLAVWHGTLPVLS